MELIVVLPLVSAFFIIFLGFFVFFKNRQEHLNIIFLLFTIVDFIWFFGTFMMFAGNNPLFWDKFVYVGVIFIPSLVYHFSVIFIQKEVAYKKSIIVGYVLSTIFLGALLFTNLFIADAFYYAWGVHAKAQILHHFFLAFFVIYLGLMYHNLIIYYKKAKNKNEKNKTLYIFIALAFLTIGAIGFLPAYEIAVYPLAYISGLIFAIIMAYAIGRYNFLNVKYFAADMIIAVLNIVAFSSIFISDTKIDYIVNIIFFLGVMGISIVLKKSFNKEIAQKEEL
jgi:hypothetical protein